MEKHAYNLFPTPVHYFKRVLSPEQIATIHRHCIDAEAGQHGAFVGGTKSSFGREARLIDELEARYPVLAGLKKGLTQLIREFGAVLGFNNLAMDNSWFNVQYPGSILKHHLHSFEPNESEHRIVISINAR